MSFSSEIKQILCKTDYECPGCRSAELAGFFRFTGRTQLGEIRIPSSGVAGERIRSLLEDDITPMQKMPENNCCRIAYIRGAFLAGGSVSDPQKEYHLEFDAKSGGGADELAQMLTVQGFRPKKTVRKGREVVYIKESSQIADLIGYMSGGMAGLEILSVQVEKELKSSIVRQVNCDSANLNKLAKASSKQIAAIKKIKAARKWSSMPEVLREIGDLRLKYPDISIEALGKMTKQQIGKSGVNHRLHRIIEFADSLGN